MINSRSFLVGLVLVAMSGCAKSEPPQPQVKVEESAPISEPVLLPTITETRTEPVMTSPHEEEVVAAVNRVFKGAAVVKKDRSPNFVVGDFNGDSSQDLAVRIAVVNDRVSEINDELGPWILVDPVRQAQVDLAHAQGSVPVSLRSRVVIEATDDLLAVIHGYEQNGWRDAQATQTYLLKNITANLLATRDRREIARAVKNRELPQFRGTLITLVVNTRTTFLYYDGAKYSWYDERTYTPPKPARLVHGRATDVSPR